MPSSGMAWLVVFTMKYSKATKGAVGFEGVLEVFDAARKFLFEAREYVNQQEGVNKRFCVELHEVPKKSYTGTNYIQNNIIFSSCWI